jgi:hypothetical protein
MPPQTPTAGRDTALLAISAPTVSTRRLCVQLLIFVSCKQTTMAPEEMIWLLTDARFAPSFKPLTFQHIMLQFLADITKTIELLA